MTQIFNLAGEPLTPQLGGNIIDCIDYAREHELDLTRADFSGKNLRHAAFDGLTLIEASFHDANISHASFSDCTLIAAKFSLADARFANFTDANLTAASLHSANFSSARLDSANLQAINATGLYIARASVLDTNLAHTAWAYANDFVLQLSASHHTITVINDQITIGCLTHSYHEWIRFQRRISDEAGAGQVGDGRAKYGKADIAEYAGHVRYCARAYESWLMRRGRNELVTASTTDLATASLSPG